jgi:1-acyl-sn-glycerol-3-phosphate acyltransferase
LIRTPFFLVTMPLWTLFMMLAGLPLSFISPDYLHNWGRLWAKGGLTLAGARLKVHGREHIPRDLPVILMPNHASGFDILAMLAGTPIQFRWLAKAELFKIPIFGLTMLRAGYIPIDRSDRRKALTSMKEAAQRISAGTSVTIFPEGTRTPDGRLLPFKKGGFMLALQSGAKLVPVAIKGSFEVMSKNSLRLSPGQIEVTFFPPVEVAGKTARDVPQLMEQVSTPIAAQLATTSAT